MRKFRRCHAEPLKRADHERRGERSGPIRVRLPLSHLRGPFARTSFRESIASAQVSHWPVLPDRRARLIRPRARHSAAERRPQCTRRLSAKPQAGSRRIETYGLSGGLQSECLAWDDQEMRRSVSVGPKVPLQPAYRFQEIRTGCEWLCPENEPRAGMRAQSVFADLTWRLFQDACKESFSPCRLARAPGRCDCRST
jgi:hypothetical protein